LVLTCSQIQALVNINPLLNTATDCLRFVTEFFDVIRQSGTHIYHSALVLAPQLSVVRSLYHQQICSPVSRVVTGIPASWDSCTASAGAEGGVPHAVWSPCGQFVAACFKDIIRIQDPNTLGIVSVLKPPKGHKGAITKFLSFSPNGRLLASVHHGFAQLVILSIPIYTY